MTVTLWWETYGGRRRGRKEAGFGVRDHELKGKEQPAATATIVGTIPKYFKVILVATTEV